jgi:hypothetical protein
MFIEGEVFIKENTKEFEASLFRISVTVMDPIKYLEKIRVREGESRSLLLNTSGGISLPIVLPRIQNIM